MLSQVIYESPFPSSRRALAPPSYPEAALMYMQSKHLSHITLQPYLKFGWLTSEEEVKKSSMVGLTVQRLISKGQSNKMSFTHTSPCGFQSRSQCVFCHNLRRAISGGGNGRGGLKPCQCVTVPATKIGCQLTSLVARDNVDGGHSPCGEGDALAFLCLFVFSVIVGSSQSESQANLHSCTKPCICNQFPVEMEISLLIM